MAEHVQGSRLLRMARLAGVAARTTRDMLTAKAREKLGGSEVDVAAALQPTAERLVEVLGELKGAATKLGQFISLVDQDTFPEEARKTLTRLLNQTPNRMDSAQVREVLARELNGTPESLFATFEEEPLASASMGQVHGATTLDGRDVVVKIQFPGIDKAIESDLRNVALLARSLSFAGNLLDGRGYAEEIAATLRRELDYKEEIRQLEQFRTAAAPWPELVIPQPLPELSTTRVLVLERLRGPTMLQVAQDPETPADVRLRVSSQLVTATWGPFLRARLVHADPHPGNYIVLPDGRLGVLDFGATKVLSVPFTLAYWQILDACMHGEPMDLTAILSSAGFEIQGEPERLARYLQDLARIIERPLRDVDYDWAACRITPDVRDLTQRNALTALRCRAPDESLSFYRAAAGVAGDLRMLRSRGDFQSVMAQLMATARAHLEPELVSATHRRLPV